MTNLLDRVLRTGEGRTLRKLAGIAEQVNLIESDFEAMSDADLRALTDEFRQRLEDGETLDDILPEAFATVREAAKRTLGQRHYDVQIMGGAALHLGNISEMRTGEGKTLVATCPTYLNALSGKGVHVITVNDYLAEYQADLMGRVHRFLGLTVGTILSQQSPAVRRKQYACDVTYGTNNEFGFDYLRDNMAWSATELVQRGHHYAIVDEVDSILIDEARTPLIISGPADQATKWYSQFAQLVAMLKKGEAAKDSIREGKVAEAGDYSTDEKKRTIAVHEQGIAKVEDWLGIDNLYESVHTPLIGYLNNAIRAKELFRRDKDYIVVDGEVLIVDEHTGRVLSGRRYNEGMHQAIEAKEGVAIKDENQTLATITLQNFFRLYEKLAGMTGTAMTEAAEFDKIYKLGVVQIPTNMPMIRADQADLVYKTEDAKFAAVVEDIAERYEKGQPVLVGTVSVAKSEHLSELLRKRGIKHEVLNAKQHAREAAVIAEAGRKGAVTVATNMAGRGTDIMLGGNVEFIAHAELERKGLIAADDPEEYESAWPAALEAATSAAAAEHDEVAELGGLYVLGTERHESRRIDNQLRGRSGRQGDPGESRFYLSLGDDLMRLFKAAAVEQVLTRFNIPDDVPIESKLVTRAIQSAQSQVEQQNFEIRKNVLKYDEVLNRQRLVIYDERRRVLHGEDLRDQILRFIEETIDAYIAAETADAYAEEWDLDKLWAAFKALYPIGIEVSDVLPDPEDKATLDAAELREKVKDDALDSYDRRESGLGEGVMRELERRVVLSVLDRKWREHLYEMDYLREGIGLRAMASRDPLVEYQREGYELFNVMMEAIREESVGYIFNVEVQVDAAAAAGPADSSADGADADDSPHITAKGLAAPERPKELQYTAPTIDGEGEVHYESTGENGDGSVGDSEDGRASSRKAAKGTRSERRAARKNKG